MRRLVAWAALAAIAFPPAAAAGPAVTVYTQDLAFVREARTLTLAGGRDTVRIEDVPRGLDFGSARLAPADASARVTRLAWRYDVASGEDLLERALGARVVVVSKGDRVTEGELVAQDPSWIVVRSDDGAVSTLARGAVEGVRLARPPAVLATRPALEAVVEGGKRGSTEAELSYLTDGLSWQARHTLIRRGERSATWSSTVIVDNRSGRDYRDATLRLVAGEPRRAASHMPRPKMMMSSAMREGVVADEALPQLEEQAFAEYHLYSLARPATLRDRESQALTLLEPREIKIAPRYLFRAAEGRGVQSQIVLVDDRASGLGVPLPAGLVRFYEPDASGALQFTGETSIAHTAEGEKLTLDVGRAFDLVGERKQLSDRRITDREREYAVEITLRNRKPSDVTIVVEESVAGEVEILKQSHPFARKDASTLTAEVAVPAGREVVVSYTARVRY